MFFKQNKFLVIKNAISYELANFIFNYFLLKRDAVDYMYKNNFYAESPLLGTWKDEQVPNVYSHYSDFVMETLLVKVMPIIMKETDIGLLPTYSYARIYKKGSILKKHKDRPSCEISATLNLGGDLWPIYISPLNSNNTDIKIELFPGDLLVYAGCELEHWREEFTGDLCGQVFLHYNNIEGQFEEKNKFDGRPMLGIPKFKV